MATSAPGGHDSFPHIAHEFITGTPHPALSVRLHPADEFLETSELTYFPLKAFPLFPNDLISCSD